MSPSAMARAVVEKAAVRMGRRAAVLAKVVRSIVGERVFDGRQDHWMILRIEDGVWRGVGGELG